MKLFEMQKSTILAFIFLLFFSIHSHATHLYGGELFYKNISGNKYTVTIVLYGDCGASSTVFSTLYSASPQVKVYNGTTLFRTLNLKVLAGAGTEITPVCASSLGSTTCNGGTVPGVRRFAYSDTITLLPSANWAMRFNGVLGTTSSAGRSSSITNITSPGTSLMSLQATLDNSVQGNSSPNYTTIPTPFFCINVAQEYNPGAVDSNITDSLAYELVDGLDPASTTVTYKSGYSATSPLAYSTGTFSFSGSSGQLTFTPNLAQVSLVVYRISEYRGGVLVGTSMREMNFIVLSTCSNRSPYGKISSVTGGAAISNTAVNICKNETLLTFSINPVDSDLNSISVSVAGLPTGATFTITASGTTTPTTAFSWNISAVAVGTYTFFVTYQDDGCPLSSKQTVAYTINVLPKPTFLVNKLSPATCVKKEVFEIVPAGGGTWNFKVLSGTSLIHSLTGTGNIIDSLSVGTYTFRVTNANGCYNDTTYEVIAPPKVLIDSVMTTQPLCFGGFSGTATIYARGGLSPFQYKIDASSFSTFSKMAALAAGAHTITVRDGNFCTKDTSITILQPEDIIINVQLKKPLCNATTDGEITILGSGGTAPYRYTIGASGTFGMSNSFAGLAAGTYLLRVKDANDCIKEKSILLTDSIKVKTTYSVQNVSCFGGNDGAILFSPYVGKLPFSYAMGTGTFSSSASFGPLAAGVYSFKIKDNYGCYLDTTATITEPTVLKLSLSFSTPTCNGYKDGKILASGSGGTTPYLYSIDGGAFVSSSLFGSLGKGTYKITIKDAKNCSKDSTITFGEPEPIYFDTKIQMPLCNGDANATVLVAARGGTATYTYAYDALPTQVSNLLENLNAGSHTISVVDKNNCKKDSIINISEPSKLAFDKINITQPTCENYADGTIIISAKGATPKYLFAINNGTFSSNFTFNKLKEGSYKISVRDSNNCQKDTTLNLVGYPKIILDSVNAIPTTCYGKADGSFMLFASGGNPPLRYVLENTFDSLMIASYNNLSSKNYVITVVDDKNCFKNFDAYVPQPNPLKIGTNITHNDCVGIDTDGRITAIVTGGTMPYQYRWSVQNNNTDSFILRLENGFYALWVNDKNDCKDSLRAEIYYDNCCTPGIPNAFTPNNDGRNDVFRILYKGDVELKEFSIYNRYGQQVFTTNSVNVGWDGKFNGRDEDLGVYYYLIKMICGNEKNHEIMLKGDVTLVK